MFLRFGQVAAQRQPVLARHHDVEQDEVGGLLEQRRAGLGRVLGLAHDEPLADEVVRQRFAQARLVVDEQDAGRGRIVHQCSLPLRFRSAGVARRAAAAPVAAHAAGALRGVLRG